MRSARPRSICLALRVHRFALGWPPGAVRAARRGGVDRRGAGHDGGGDIPACALAYPGAEGGPGLPAPLRKGAAWWNGSPRTIRSATRRPSPGWRTAAEAIARGEAEEAIWLLEHPALYTAGTSARVEDLKDPDRFPVPRDAARRAIYLSRRRASAWSTSCSILNRRGRDVRAFVTALETWVIRRLAEFNLRGEIRAGRVGVWIAPARQAPLPDRLRAEGQDRGDRRAGLRKWVSFHGISINHDPDLAHFDGIVPCGIEGHGVTSLVDLGLPGDDGRPRPVAEAELRPGLRPVRLTLRAPPRPAGPPVEPAETTCSGEHVRQDHKIAGFGGQRHTGRLW